MSGFKPTHEQVDIVDAAATGDNLVIEAAAGSGKTSTLKLIANHARTRGLYLAYNAAIKDDAAKSFPSSVRASTAHGLAYRPVAGRYINAGKKVGGRRVPPQEAARILGINDPVRLAGDLAPLAPQQLARIAVATVDRFCYSAADTPMAEHVPLYPGLEDELIRAELAKAVLPYAARAWADVQDLHGRLRFTHDHYLKMYQLSRPRLEADYLLVDEAQDLNPVVQALVADQTHAQVLLVGDRCQQLYAWRGAVDAMKSFDGKRLYLTQSFRFGEQVAEEANKWLAVLHADIRVRGFGRVPSVVGPLLNPDAVLCRSNAAAFGRVMDAIDRGRRVALVGGGGAISSLARAARDLMDGRPTDHPELLAFTSWNEVRDYVAQDASAGDLAVFVGLIDKWGPEGVLHIVDRLVDERTADLVVSTAHKAKGREWAGVKIATDFREPAPKEDGSRGRIAREDAMLAYVAVTRAMTGLDREGLAWVDPYVPAGWSPAPARRTVERLIEASSLGTPEAVELRQSATAAGVLTGMAAEQAEWDEDEWPEPAADPQDQPEPQPEPAPELTPLEAAARAVGAQFGGRALTWPAPAGMTSAAWEAHRVARGLVTVNQCAAYSRHLAAGCGKAEAATRALLEVA
jgi:hypothetical protein